MPHQAAAALGMTCRISHLTLSPPLKGSVARHCVGADQTPIAVTLRLRLRCRTTSAHDPSEANDESEAYARAGRCGSDDPCGPARCNLRVKPMSAYARA